MNIQQYTNRQWTDERWMGRKNMFKYIKNGNEQNMWRKSTRGIKKSNHCV